MSTEKLVSGLRSTLDSALEAEARDDKAAAVAKTAAIKNIQKALTARILKRLDDGQPLVEVARKMKAIEGMQPQINDMERRLGIMQSVEPVLENAIKTLQKVVDVRGMGKSSLVMTAPAEINVDGPSKNQLLMEAMMSEDAKEDALKAEVAKEEAAEKAKEEAKTPDQKKEDKKEEAKAKADKGISKPKCEWKPPALKAIESGAKPGAAPAEEKKEEKKGEEKKEAAPAEEKKAEAPPAAAFLQADPAPAEEKKEEKKEEGKEEKKEEKKDEKAAEEEDCEPLTKQEEKDAEKEYKSIRAAEKAEKAAAKAELDHKTSPMEVIR